MLAFWLHWRRAAGWGRSLEELRFRRKTTLDVFRVVVPYLFLGDTLLIWIVPALGAHHFSLYALIRLMKYFLPWFVVIEVLLLLSIINYTVRLRRGEALGTQVHGGR